MEKNYVAEWRPGAERGYNKNINVQKVADEIISVGGEDEFNLIKAEDVVDMARDENTETHKLLEWDDTVAAEKYRVTQVRNIMHDIHITYIKTNENKTEKIGKPVRLFYNVAGETGYRPTPVIMKNEDLHKRLLLKARIELQAYLDKYKELSELTPLLNEINKYIYELKIFDDIA